MEKNDEKKIVNLRLSIFLMLKPYDFLWNYWNLLRLPICKLLLKFFFQKCIRQLSNEPFQKSVFLKFLHIFASKWRQNGDKMVIFTLKSLFFTLKSPFFTLKNIEFRKTDFYSRSFDNFRIHF